MVHSAVLEELIILFRVERVQGNRCSHVCFYGNGKANSNVYAKKVLAEMLAVYDPPAYASSGLVACYLYQQEWEEGNISYHNTHDTFTHQPTYLRCYEAHFPRGLNAVYKFESPVMPRANIRH